MPTAVKQSSHASDSFLLICCKTFGSGNAGNSAALLAVNRERGTFRRCALKGPKGSVFNWRNHKML
jgi:hypothetical protein